MTMPLGKLPSELLPQIQVKMTPTSFCRLRQTCREMDQFCEKNRFQTKVFCDQTRWLLFIAVGEENKPGFNFEIKPFKYYLDDHRKQYENMKTTNSNVHGVMDPYNQLSALKFEFILVDYFSCETFFDSYAFKQHLLPLLDDLKLECDFLTFASNNDLFRQKTNLMFQERIQFSSLQNFTLITTGEFQPIQNLEEHYLGTFTDLPSHLGSMIKHLKRAILKFRLHDGNGRCVDLLEEFLKEICKDKRNKGNLEYFIFDAGHGDQNILKQSDSLIDLWKGDMIYFKRTTPVTLQKLKFEGGAAIVQNLGSHNKYLIHFLKKDDRFTLIQYVSEEVLVDPLDLSAVFEDAMEAPDDKTAVEILVKNYHPEPEVIVPEPETDSEAYFSVVCVVSVVVMFIGALKMTDQ